MSAADVLTTVATSTPWGQALGLVGGLASGVLSFFQRKQDRAHELALKAEEMKLLIASANVNQAALAGELAKLREDGAAKAFTASIEADAKLPRSYRWIDALRAITRPGLTWYFTVAFTCMSMAVLCGWAGSLFDSALAVFIFTTAANMMQMCVTWWFGQRQIDRMTTEWGNKMVNARVSGSPTSPTK
jgi:hypothetical protein